MRERRGRTRCSARTRMPANEPNIHANRSLAHTRLSRRVAVVVCASVDMLRARVRARCSTGGNIVHKQLNARPHQILVLRNARKLCMEGRAQHLARGVSVQAWRTGVSTCRHARQQGRHGRAHRAPGCARWRAARGQQQQLRRPRHALRPAPAGAPNAGPASMPRRRPPQRPGASPAGPYRTTITSVAPPPESVTRVVPFHSAEPVFAATRLSIAFISTPRPEVVTPRLRSDDVTSHFSDFFLFFTS